MSAFSGTMRDLSWAYRVWTEDGWTQRYFSARPESREKCLISPTTTGWRCSWMGCRAGFYKTVLPAPLSLEGTEGEQFLDETADHYRRPQKVTPAQPSSALQVVVSGIKWTEPFIKHTVKQHPCLAMLLTWGYQLKLGRHLHPFHHLHAPLVSLMA